jgi:hypothetical protein
LVRTDGVARLVAHDLEDFLDRTRCADGDRRRRQAVEASRALLLHLEPQRLFLFLALAL